MRKFFRRKHALEHHDPQDRRPLSRTRPRLPLPQRWQEEIYLGPADWLNRDIYRRIEVCFPEAIYYYIADK